MYFMPMFPLMFLESRYVTGVSELHEGVFQAVGSWLLPPRRMKWILMFRVGVGGGMVLGLKNWVILWSPWTQFPQL